MLTLTRAQCREVDRRAIEQYGLPGVVLMENAGRGVVDGIERLGLAGPFLICCGKGNNAGDGFVIARHLHLREHRVQVAVWATEEEMTGDAGVNFRALRHTSVPVERFAGPQSARLTELLANAGTVVDALLGTGARGEPRPPLAEVIAQLNASGKPIVAVDLPSGLDCDTGLPAVNTIRAQHTFTFLAVKAGFLAPGAERYTGEVYVCDIGVPREWITNGIGD